MTSEYFADKRFKRVNKQEQLTQCALGNHQWSNWFTSPRGLAQECKGCHEIRYHPDYDKLNPNPEHEKLWLNEA